MKRTHGTGLTTHGLKSSAFIIARESYSDFTFSLASLLSFSPTLPLRCALGFGSGSSRSLPRKAGLRLLSFVFCLLSFVFCLLSFAFCLLSCDYSHSIVEGGFELIS